MSLKLKLAVLVALLVACSTYTEEDHVLVLTTEDFDSILKEFPQIMIEFYAPWYHSA